jgi:hypothetical protein
MSRSAMRRLALDGVDLEVEVQGRGKPVLLIQTALVADEFLPLASQPALRGHYRVIRHPPSRGRGRRGRLPAAPPDPRERVTEDDTSPTSGATGKLRVRSQQGKGLGQP